MKALIVLVVVLVLVGLIVLPLGHRVLDPRQDVEVTLTGGREAQSVLQRDR